jgi:hypothetical protein
VDVTGLVNVNDIQTITGDKTFTALLSADGGFKIAPFGTPVLEWQNGSVLNVGQVNSGAIDPPFPPVVFPAAFAGIPRIFLTPNPQPGQENWDRTFYYVDQASPTGFIIRATLTAPGSTTAGNCQMNWQALF